ncbi:hypothetical protein BOX15_Mlig018030g1 [Macrostomum lignano]|uniref:Dimethylargininase n=2 Tax=Macrostomum lignano TaxID=282301 RepID=A0A1I8II05_9PLAT|nr:hypothetical protein BOX15_Mlig018030g1 [Macrostomum lignano]
MAFKYNYAIVQRIPKSFAQKYPKINVDQANEEQETLVEILRQSAIDILEIDVEERHPTSPFVDDTAVIINNIALMCNPYGNRQGEVSAIRQTLKRQLGMKVAEISIDGAALEGSDVLFTDKEIIVGISPHTNEAGATCVAKTFPEYPVTTVTVHPLESKKAGHTSLKDLVCMAGASVIAVGLSPSAQKTLKEINWKASYNYRIIQLPEDQACNCLYVNGYLVHLAPDLIPSSIGIFENKIDYNRIPISLPHLVEQRVSMTKLCLLVQKTKNTNLKSIMSTLP